MTEIVLYLKTHNITGMKYLGQTSRDPYKYQGSGLDWKAHIKENGYDVSTQILLITNDMNELAETGLFFSKLWDVQKSKDFANRVPEGGKGGVAGIKLTEEHKRKLKENHVGNTGKKCSEETRQKIITAMTGMVFTEDHKSKLKENHRGNTGRKFSETHKQKISSSNKGRIFTEEHKQKLSIAAYNRQH